MLALIAERVTGQPFPSLVEERVCAPAGMHATAFLRSDALPGRAAVGYLDSSPGSRTNVLHLPVIGSGDGGIYTTLSDIHRLWEALRANRIVHPGFLQKMWEPRSDVPKEGGRYGLGFWLHATGPAVLLEGSDAGGSFRTMYAPDQCTFTVISNVSNGAWTVAGDSSVRFSWTVSVCLPGRVALDADDRDRRDPVPLPLPLQAGTQRLRRHLRGQIGMRLHCGFDDVVRLSGDALQILHDVDAVRGLLHLPGLEAGNEEIGSLVQGGKISG